MLRSRAWCPGLRISILATLVMSCATGAPDDDRQKVEVIKPDAQDVSPALRDLAKIPVPEVIGLRARQAEPWRSIPHPQLQAFSQQRDPVVQDAIGAANIPSTLVTFEGMGAGLPGFSVQSAPPDTDGDVGPNHYVQIVNSGVTVFSRTGAK